MKTVEKKNLAILPLHNILGDLKLIPALDNDFYNHKLSFIIEVNSGAEKEGFKAKLRKEFPGSIVKGNLASFEKEGIKVNLNMVEPGLGKFRVETSAYFINFFLGKMVKSFGLTLRPNMGLIHVHYHTKTYPFKEIVVTTDPGKVFQLLELDYEKFVQGFKSPKEVFDFVATSPYFNVDHYTNDEDEEGIFIEEFVKNLRSFQQTHASKTGTIHDVDRVFPELKFLEQYQKLEKEREEIETVNAKFNGKIAIEHFPEFPAREVGHTFGNFKFSFRDEFNFRQYVLLTDIEKIFEDFRKHLK